MGQFNSILINSNHSSENVLSQSTLSSVNNIQSFYDLNQFPPEIAVSILSNLNATDLCLASCVWKNLAEDEILWKGLCLSRWNYTSIYSDMIMGKTPSKIKAKPFYKSLYLLLDEATLLFAFRPNKGIKYLIEHNVLEDNAKEIARFIEGASILSSKSLQQFVKERRDVLDELVSHMYFTGLSICDGLRKYFKKIHPPEERGDFLDVLVDKYATRYVACNPNCGFITANVGVLCYSLLLLSVDLYSPHVKNKMSKREFIRNNRQVLEGDVSRDLLGDIYDDVYLNGHIVPNSRQVSTSKKQSRFPFYRPYGAMFEFQPIQISFSCSC